MNRRIKIELAQWLSQSKIVSLFCAVSLLQAQTLQELFPQLSERLRWESYWQRDASSQQFKPFKNKPVSAYLTSTMVGFCVPHLRWCSAYALSGRKVGRRLARGECDTESSPNTCLLEFLREHKLTTLGSVDPRAVIATETVSMGGENDTREMGSVIFNEQVEQLKSWLRKTYFREADAGRTIVIPRISASDPEIYVLLEVPSPRLSAILLVRNSQERSGFEDLGEIVSIWPRYLELRRRILESAAWRGTLP